MREKTLVWFAVILFLLIQGLGLYVGKVYLDFLTAGIAEPVFENPERVENSLILVFYIILATGFLLLIIKFWKKIIKLFETIITFIACWLTFELLFPYEISFIPIGLILSLFLCSWKLLRPNILNQNLTLIFSITGIGAVLGGSLGILPSICFLLILSVYDFISVFITKHMVYMAKEIIKTSSSFTLSIPSKLRGLKKVKFGKKVKVRVFQLGGGDLAAPLLFSVSVLKKFSLLHSIFITVFSTISLALLLNFLTKKPRKPLPALPWIAAGSLSGFLISLVIL